MKILAFAVLAVVLASCARHEAQEASAGPTVEQREVVAFPHGSPQIAQLQSEPVEPRRDVKLRFNGRLVWNEDRTVRVFAPFNGRVQSVAVRPGDRVKAGQVLATLAAPELGVAQAEARKADNDYGLAQKNLLRVRELAEAGVAPAKDLQVAQADVARTQAERDRTHERLKLYGGASDVDQKLLLRAPIAGVVVERNLNQGQELRADQGDKPLFVVSDPAHLWFVLDVGEQDAGRVKAGTAVRLAAASLGEARVAGHVVHVADYVDPQTRTVRVRGALDDPDSRLKAEMYVVGEVRVEAPGGYLVPTRAIYLRGEQYFVFVDEGNGRYRRRAIRPGPILNGHQEVLEGLTASDRVVVDGNLLLERILAEKD